MSTKQPVRPSHYVQFKLENKSRKNTASQINCVETTNKTKQLLKGHIINKMKVKA